MSGADTGRVPVVHCVVPVHNRLAITRRFVAQMHQQDYPSISVVVVDDGSTDGTGQWLASLGDARFRVITGSGSLWWGGAMTLGMREVFSRAHDDDYLLMLNDDVRIRPDYVSALVRASADAGGAVVGSAQRLENSGKSFAAAYHIDYARMRFLEPVDGASIDALPARGTLFPVRVARAAGVIHRGLPHHLGDLEYTARVKERGAMLIVSPAAEILTEDVPPSQAAARRGAWHRWFGRRSPDNLWQRMIFFHSRGPFLLRIVALPRHLLSAVLRRLASG